jgi:O-antigen ligase
LNNTEPLVPAPSGTHRDIAVSWLAAALPGFYLLLTSTTNLVPGIWPYDAKRMLQFVLLLLLFVLPLVNRPVRDELGRVLSAVPAWVGATLLALFAWGTVSALANAQSPMHLANSFSEVALLGSLVLGVFVIAACRRLGGRAFDRIAIGLIALTGLAVGAQELLGVAAAHASGVDFNFRISLLHFSWPRFYNQVQSWVIPVLVALPMIFSRYRLARVLCVVVLALHWYIVLMTGARGTFIAVLAAMTFAALFLPLIRKPLLGWQAIGLALGAVLYGAVLLSFQAGPSGIAGAPSSSSLSEESTSPPAAGFYGNENEKTSSFLAQSTGRPLLDPMGRTWMWKVTLRDARAHPVLGIGPMNYVCTSPVYMGHPHNFPLQLAAEWGIPAALAVCLLFAIILVRLTHSLRVNEDGDPDDRKLASLLLTGVLAAALHACVSGVMVMPASQVTGLLICGLALGLAPNKKHRARARYSMLAAAGGMTMAIGLLILGTHELRTLAERSVQLRPGEDLRPRIWQDAKVCRLYAGQTNGTK